MVNPDWKSQVGASTSVKWVAGAGAKGSDGVAGTVKNIVGGIGYVESAYAAQNKLTTTQMRNKAGAFVSPDMSTFAAAAAAADWSKVQNFAVDLNDQQGPKSWPIESATFVLLPTDPKDPSQNAAVEKFFAWGFKDGNKIAEDLLYVPLPAPVQAAIQGSWPKTTASK
jgi:phosphate transport system substrate-binding protein